jgi:hypothetical protein
MMMMNDLKPEEEGSSQADAECAEQEPDSATSNLWMILVSAMGLRFLLGSTLGVSGVMLVEFTDRFGDASLPLLNTISSMQLGVSLLCGECMV